MNAHLGDSEIGCDFCFGYLEIKLPFVSFGPGDRYQTIQGTDMMCVFMFIN
jgi:hypothetical protein